MDKNYATVDERDSKSDSEDSMAMAVENMSDCEDDELVLDGVIALMCTKCKYLTLWKSRKSINGMPKRRSRCKFLSLVTELVSSQGKAPVYTKFPR